MTDPDLLRRTDPPTEEVLEPRREIIDAHHHLWDRPRPQYLFHDFLADLQSGHNIVATVHVEAQAMCRAEGPEHLKPVGETEFVRGAAAMAASGLYGRTRVAAGIVAFADLTLGPQVEEALDAHAEAAGGRLRGIRDAAAWDEDQSIRRGTWLPDKGRYLSPEFRAGFAHLARRGLTFDAWLYHPQIDDLVDLAGAFPETTIILNHVGGFVGIGRYAADRAATMDAWRRSIRALARLENVRVKLGGLGMWLSGFGFEKRQARPPSTEVARAYRPFIEFCIEQFGAERCMFESNFPPDKVSCSYLVLWNAFKRIASSCSEDEKTALFKETANRTYRLNV